MEEYMYEREGWGEKDERRMRREGWEEKDEERE